MYKKTVIVLWLFFSVLVSGSAQTLIATSTDPNAISNHSQRKIVRDSAANAYIVFSDTINSKSVIKGVWYENSTGFWSSPTYLVDGKNPTISISKTGHIHLLYESNDAVTRIIHTSTDDFSVWTPSFVVSDTTLVSTLPISDVDSSGRLNIFWCEKNGAFISLIYASVMSDTLVQKKNITTKSDISDIAIANNLQFFNDDLFFAIQFDQDSILFFRSDDYMTSFDTIFSGIGNNPCITFNGDDIERLARFLYIDNNSNLIEIEFDYNATYTRQIQTGGVNFVCIDNLAPPIGYSYLFMKNGVLYHSFSYGPNWTFNTNLDTINSSHITASIAYKTFNFYFVDYIWMEDAGNYFNIFHKRDPKHEWLGTKDIETNKGFSIIGYPNPFSEFLVLKVSSEKTKEIPQVKIFDYNSKLINILEPISSFSDSYEYQWTGLDLTGNKVSSGIYVVTCSIGGKMTARKISFVNNH